MKIGIDLRSLESGEQHRGIGRYATELLEALSNIDHSNEYVFFVSHPKALPPQFKLHKKFNYHNEAGKGEGLRGIKYIRIVYILPRSLSIDKYGLDVFLQIDTLYSVKARKTPVVSVVYDLIPYIYKDQYQHIHLGGYSPGHLIGYSRGKLRWKMLERQLDKYADAEQIISISEHSKKDLISFVQGIQPERITVTPLGPGSTKTAPKLSKRLTKLKTSSFLFYLGGADPRKGLVNFMKDMELIWQKYPTTNLVLAGKEIVDDKVAEARKLKRAIASSSKPQQVHCFGYVSDSEMYWLYKNAAAFVFPSRYEGFGLPVLEAMMAGSPVVTYDNSSIPEVAGEATALVKDGTSLAPAVNELLKSPNLRKQMVVAGKKQAAKFTWDKTARATLKVLETAAESKL